MATSKKFDTAGDVATLIRTEKKLKRPRMYKVLIHNDDFTPMEFVVMILESIFNKDEGEATVLMLHVHTRGMGVAGIFSKEIAETKVLQVMATAEKAGYPLLCTMESVDDGEGA